MKISVMICTRDRPKDIEHCLPAVLRCDYADFDVVLVDQSDGKETAELAHALKLQYPNLVYVPTETRGKSLALNLGVHNCTGEIIACTDDDCEMEKDWVAHIAQLFNADPDMHIVVGQVLPPADFPSDDGAVPALTFTEKRILRKGEIFGMGANMAFRRAFIEKLHGYDTILGPGAPLVSAEEFDLFYRAQCLDAKIVADPSLTLVHRAVRTQDQWSKVLYGYGFGDAAFYLKHARCGDLWALSILLRKIVWSVARQVVGPLIGKGRGGTTYLPGLLSGIRKSLKFGIDRTSRLYLTASKTA